jgi:hypothetical protein
MASTAPFVVLGGLAHHPAQQAARLVFPCREQPVVCSPDELTADEVRLHVLAIRGAKKLRGSTRLAKLTQLATGSAHHWVVRRDAAHAIASLAPEGDVRVVPAPLVDEEGWLDGDWALLDVRARIPLDRRAASFVPTTAGAPHASLVAKVERVAWSSERTPRAPLFRVAEAPELLVARADVAARIAQILGPWAVPIEPPYDAPVFEGKPCGRLSGAGGLHREPQGGGPAFAIDEAAGEAAFAALDRLLSGEGASSDRERACSSPITAYFLARLVDGAPSDDTRAGALGHPRYATLYARDVDRGPRDDTRRVAATERFSAFAYLEYVERALHPDLVAMVGATNAASLLENSSSMRSLLQPPVERFPASWSFPSEAANPSEPVSPRGASQSSKSGKSSKAKEGAAAPKGARKAATRAKT